MERLALPNEHKLIFENHFKYNKLNTNFYPVYYIPCRKEDDGEIVPSVRFALFFSLDEIGSHTKTQEFFKNPYLKKDYKFPQSYYSAVEMGYSFEDLIDSKKNQDNRLKVEAAVNFAEEEGYPDLIVGYYDTTKDTFVQGLYLKDFHINETYNILEYYMYKTWQELYLNENVFDKKVVDSAHLIIDELSFDLFRSDIVEMVEKLKLSCLEGSFNSSYSNEYKEMNEEITYVLSKYIEDYKPEQDFNKLLELSSFLRSLDVIEFYANQNDKNFIPISEIIKSGKKDNYFDSMVIAFHPRLKGLLSDKFN